MIKVRHAEPGDVDEVLELARSAWSEGRYSRLSFDEAKARSHFYALSESADGCVLVAENEVGLVGFMAGLATEFFFAPQRRALEIVMFVEPEHRKSWAGIRLVNAFLAWAESRDVVEIEVGVSIGIEDEQAVKFYERLGFAKGAHHQLLWRGPYVRA